MNTNEKVLFSILSIFLIICISVIAAGTINDTHQTELQQAYLNGRTDTVISISEQLRTTGQVLVTLPYYDEVTNQTLSATITLVMKQ